jgi:hypothetical protein
MTKRKDTTEDFDAFDCSSAFTYDEVVALIKRKKTFWLNRLHRVDSDSRDDFQALSGYVAACDYIIQGLAALAISKRNPSIAVSMSKVIEVIDTEEEFDGDIPQDVFDTASASPEAMSEALRVACRLTKQGIKRRVEALR